MRQPQDKDSQQPTKDQACTGQQQQAKKASKDPFEQGYNRGMDDGKSGDPRKPHSLKNAAKFVFMGGAKVEQYVRGYHQGYDFAIKSKRIQHERDTHADQRYQQRIEQRQAMRTNVSKARRMEHDSPEPG